MFYYFLVGYFCDGIYRNAGPKVLSQKDAIQNGIPEPVLFPLGIGMANTISLRPNFWSLFAFQNLFVRKIALFILVASAALLLEYM